MNSCVTHFLFKLSATGSSDINIYAFYKRLTFDIICSCCYGLNSPSEEYYQKVEEVFAIDVTQSLWLKLTCLLGSTSFLSQLIEKLYRLQDDFKRFLNGKQNFFQFGEFPRYWIREKVREIVDLGVESRDDVGKIDLVHLLLKATNKDGSISHGEILQNVSAFLIAGYEPTSATMAYSTYILATHPEEQLKLQMEIDSYEDEEEMSYDVVIKKFEYLDRFLREVLRMYPIAVQQLSRQCEQETVVRDEHGKEFKIGKDDIVQADVYSLHYSTNLWGPTDPGIFYPDRHITQQSQCAFLGFGLGPRQCIGMRFAMSILKLTLIRLLKEYTVVHSNKLEENWCLTDKRVITPQNCWIRLEARQ
ncbi:unnamed protein product [Adineta steineri]|uniref:Cytochrome P450 n=2 Tax=Adineta steineri TaxID=433720 RepID=A0A819IZA7_9BILA|nr:unnamed protein product [Adineta steineri]